MEVLECSELIQQNKEDLNEEIVKEESINVKDKDTPNSTLLQNDLKENMPKNFDSSKIMKDQAKICGVCGDKALGNNFNAITCESCKAFFRRNALRPKEFTCPFDNNCRIDVVTRRFCQKCRLKKCFQIGMKKEWIMSEEEKKIKRSKIDQNRLKRKSPEAADVEGSKLVRVDEHSSHKIKSTFQNNLSSSVTKIFPGALHVDKGFRRNALDCTNEIEACDYKNIPSSVSILSPSSSSCSSADVGVPSYPSPSSSSCSSIPPLIIQSQSSQVSVQDSIESAHVYNRHSSISPVFQSSPELQNQQSEPQQYPNFWEATEQQERINQHHLPGENVNHSNACKNMFYGNTTIPKQQLSTSSQTDNGDLNFSNSSESSNALLIALVKPGENKQTSAQNNHEQYSNATLSSSSEVAEQLSSPYSVEVQGEGDRVLNGYEGELPTLDAVMGIAIRAEFNSFNLMNKTQAGVYSRELNGAEAAKLQELLVAGQALGDPVDQEGPVKLSKNSDPTLINVINLTDIAIRRLIKMSKKISGFKNLCQEDQIALLKGSCTEMMILRSVVTYDPDRDSWNIPHSFGYNIKLGVLKEARGNLYEEHQRFVKSFSPKWRTDECIMILLCAITLFTPERPNVIHKDVVKLEQDSYYYLLKRYLDSILTGCEARSTYLLLIRKISELRILNSTHLRVFLEVNPREVEPLLREVFSMV